MSPVRPGQGKPLGRPAVVAATVMAFAVAWSRVYMGVHYPSDVVVSFPAAIAAVILVAGLWNRFAPPARPVPFHGRPGELRPRAGRILRKP